MRKKYLTLLLGLTAALTLTACSGNKSTEETEASTAALEELAAEDLDMEEFSEEITVEDLDMEEFLEETETEPPIEPITPSDYLVQNAADYVTTTQLEGLEAIEYTYETTDELIQERIQSELEMYSEEIEVDRGAEDGDVIYMDLTYTTESGSFSESSYLLLGTGEFGTEFDQELTGAKAGDTLEFSITFDDSVYVEDWIDQTVEFEIEVSSVCELNVPEYTDEYVQDYLGYDSREAYEEEVKATLIAENEEMSYVEVIEALFQEAISCTVFGGYPEELYESCQEEVLAFYQSFADTSDLTEIYDLFGITEADVEEEVLNMVNRRLLVSKICLDEDITVTSDEYMNYITEYAEYYGYESASAFEQDYTRSTIVWSLYETKAGELLYESANITQASGDELMEGMDDAEVIDDLEMVEELEALAGAEIIADEEVGEEFLEPDEEAMIAELESVEFTEAETLEAAE